MNTELQKTESIIDFSLENLKGISDEEFDKIKQDVKGRFDSEIEEILIAIIERKRSEFKTRN